MELEKGRIRITERDKLCAEFVVEQGFATIEQLWKVAWSDHKNTSYAYDRVLVLERSGFLKQVKSDGVTFKIVSPTPKSRSLVASFSQHPIPFTNASKDIVFHQLDLNELRILFQKKGLSNWRSAECLAVDPSFKKIGTRHIPDAFYVSSKGVRTAIEYDRTLRKKDRIKDRLSSYVVELMSPDRNIDRLIYLVAPAYLKTYQQIFDQGFEGIKGKFILSTMEEFKKQLEGVGNVER
ncbi:MAG: hypothetical protein ACXVLQ_16025 [Bacteriovorax sp.]